MRVWNDTFTGVERVEYTFNVNRIGIFPLTVGTILDWGCSSGETTKEISQLYPGRNIIGIDIDPEIIKIAKAKQTGLEFYCIDGCNLREDLLGPYAGIFAMNNLVYGLKNNQITERMFREIIGGLIDCLDGEGYLFVSKDFQLWIYGKKENGLVYSSKIKNFGKLKKIEELINCR